jgi:hypothetical protein
MFPNRRFQVRQFFSLQRNERYVGMAKCAIFLHFQLLLFQSPQQTHPHAHISSLSLSLSLSLCIYICVFLTLHFSYFSLSLLTYTHDTFQSQLLTYPLSRTFTHSHFFPIKRIQILSPTHAHSHSLNQKLVCKSEKGERESDRQRGTTREKNRNTFI